MPPPFSCYRLSMCRPSMLFPLLLLALACLVHFGCGDDNSGQTSICELGNDSNKISELFDPCIWDQNCIVGQCANGICSEPCFEDDDCIGAASYCSDNNICTYGCAGAMANPDSGLGCPGYDVRSDPPNLQCVDAICTSTVECG